MPQKTAHGIHGDLPDSEKPQNVVDSEGIEILRHLRQAGFPPSERVPGHPFPVVGRESPVLAESRKGIGRSAGLRIHVEQPRGEPRVGTRRTHADRQVPLEDHAPGMGIGTGVGELKMEVILDKAMEIHLPAVFPAVLLQDFPVVLRIFSPTGEIRRGVFVAQGAKERIRQQPALVKAQKLPERFLREDFRASVLESLPQKTQFLPIDPLIIDLRKGIQLLPKPQILPVGRNPRGRKVHKLGMESEGGVGVVGIRIRPGPRHRRIVYRKQLDDMLPRRHRPIDHLLQVRELSRTEVVFAPQGKDRNGGARTAPAPSLEIRNVGCEDPRPRWRRGTCEAPVLPLLPAQRSERFPIDDQVFIEERTVDAQRESPVWKRRVVQRNGLRPRPEFGNIARDGECLIGTDVGEGRANEEIFIADGPRGRRVPAPGENALRECRRVQRRIRRRVVPPVGNVRGSGRAIFGKHDPVSLPLPTDALPVPNHLVGIFPAGKVPGDTSSPSPLSAVLHRQASVSGRDDNETLSPTGIVGYLKQQFHIRGHRRYGWPYKYRQVFHSPATADSQKTHGRAPHSPCGNIFIAPAHRPAGIPEHLRPPSRRYSVRNRSPPRPGRLVSFRTTPRPMQGRGVE